MNSRPSASARITGIALIVLPLIALLLKTFSFGWMMVFIIFGPIFVMVIGYVLQVIAAAQGFLSKKGLFDAARLKRATIAAWVSRFQDRPAYRAALAKGGPYNLGPKT